jgi:hypothetical protein
MKACGSALILAAAPFCLLAQAASPAQGRRISGTVHDSTARAALAGAIVEAIQADVGRTAGSPRIFTAITDSIGHFELDELPPGPFALRFDHDALTLLGLEPEAVLVTVGDADVVRNLSIPSAATVISRSCSGANTDEGMLAGYVTQARTGEPVVRTPVIVRWSELGFEKGRMRSASREARAVLDSAGRYRICGIPSEGPVVVRVAAPRFHSFDSEMTIPAGGVTRLDLRLADAAAGGSTSTVRIQVVDDSGAAVMGGKATVAELDREAVIEGGQALLRAVPAGTWPVSVRAVGFFPVMAVVDVPGAEGGTAVVLHRIPQLLDTVLIRSPRARGDSATIRDIEARLRMANGTLIRAADLAVRNSVEASDAIRAAHGFRWRGPTKVAARPYVVGFATKECESVVHIDTLKKVTTKEVAIYLDGTRLPGGLETVNRLVLPSDILAIEAYPDVVSAPFLWRTNDTCAVIAFWTKR